MVYDPSKFLLGPMDLTGAQMKLSAIRSAGQAIRSGIQHRDSMALARDQQQLDRERMEANQDYQQQLLENQRMQAQARAEKAKQERRKSMAEHEQKAVLAAAYNRPMEFEVLKRTHGLDLEYTPGAPERVISGQPDAPELGAPLDEQPAPPPMPANPTAPPPPHMAGMLAPQVPPPSQATSEPEAPRTAPMRPNTGLLPAAALAAASATSPAPQAQAAPPPPQPVRQPAPPMLAPGFTPRPAPPPPQVTIQPARPATIVMPDGVRMSAELVRKENNSRLMQTYGRAVGSIVDERRRAAAAELLRGAMETGDESLLAPLKDIMSMNADTDAAMAKLDRFATAMEARERNRSEINFNRGTKLVDTFIKKDDLKKITGLKELRQADEMFATGNPALQMRAVTVRRNSLEGGVMTEPDYQKNTGMLDWFEQVEQKLGWAVGAAKNWWNNGVLPEGVASDEEATDALVDTKVFLPPVVLKRMRAAIGNEIEIQKPMAEQILNNAERNIRSRLPEDSDQLKGALSVLDNLRDNVGVTPGEGTKYQSEGDGKHAWAEQYRGPVEQAAEEAGVPAELLFDIMKGEGSKGRLDAKGKLLDSGGRGFGLFQINTGAHDDFDVEKAKDDPLYQARYAARLLKKKITAAGGDLKKAVGFWGSTGSPDARQTYIDNVKGHWSPETRSLVLGEEAGEAPSDDDGATDEVGDVDIVERLANGDIDVDEATDLALEAF